MNMRQLSDKSEQQPEKRQNMTTEQIIQILQWLIPIGGLGSAVTWMVRRDTRKDRTAKERNDIYKAMYDNLSDTLIELQNENKKLYRAIARLERAVTRATGCRHYDDCPMRDELQEPAGDSLPKPGSDGGRKKTGQPAKAKKSRGVVRTGSALASETELAARQCV